MNAQLLIWSVVPLIAAVDAVLLPAQGMRIASRWPAFALVVLMCGLSALIHRRNPAAARFAVAVAQIWAPSNAGAILSYTAMAASPCAMADATLARWDAALRFDWVAWFAWVHVHPPVHVVLACAYASAPIQVVLLILYFSYADRRRVDELMLAGILPVAIIIPVMMLLPPFGAWSQHGVGIEPWRADILALRDHALPVIGRTLGIISFPSYRTGRGAGVCSARAKMVHPGAGAEPAADRRGDERGRPLWRGCAERTGGGVGLDRRDTMEAGAGGPGAGIRNAACPAG